MDNKVLLSVGVFAGVLVAVGAWLLTAGGNPTVPPELAVASGAEGADAPERALPGKDPRRPMFDRKMTKRPNLAMVQDKLGAAGAQARIDRIAGLGLANPVNTAGEAVYSLDKESIAAAMDARTEDLVACYQTALFHTPDLEGKLTLTLELIPEEGQDHATVDSVTTDSELEAPVLDGCIATVFEELKFDVGDEQTTLTWPVVFRPEGTDEE